jgi:hypothetical protein
MLIQSKSFIYLQNIKDTFTEILKALGYIKINMFSQLENIFNSPCIYLKRE